jgi:glucose/arabinose dehydrogenase
MFAGKSVLVVLSLTAGLLISGSVMPSRSQAAVRSVSVATLSAPMFLTHNGDGRLFVVERAGRIRIVDPTRGGLLPAPFLDIDSKVSSGGERGLFSMAFHPDRNGFFYVYYTDTTGAVAIERYRVSANPDLADASSGQRMITVAHPADNHNGGQLQIGPGDGYLYAALGDGGGQGDASCNAQSRDRLLGKMLRLDVRQNLNQPPYYGIPAGNPFIGAADPGNQVPDEIWALGLRNPWRFSFDRATRDLYIADVGQDRIEEVDVLRASAAGGANLGWKVMEGSACFSDSACPVGTPACNAAGLTRPVAEFSHDSGDCSIIGGYVYRGRGAPELIGRYVFSDLCSGNVRTLSEVSPGSWQVRPVLELGSGVTSFGEDAAGEVYYMLGNALFRLVSDGVAPAAAVPARAPAGLLALALGLLAIGAIRWRSIRGRRD